MRIEGQGVGVRGRWSYRGNEGGTDGKKKGGGGVGCAFGVGWANTKNRGRGVAKAGKRGGSRGKKRGGGVVFAFGVSLTQSNSSRQGNLCGQRTP